MRVKSSAHPRRQACSKTVLLLLLDLSFPLNIILWPFLPNYHFHVLDCGKLAFHNRPWKLSLIRAGAEKEDCLLWTSIDGEFFMHKYLSSETTVSLSWLLSPAALCSAAALVSLHPLLLSSTQHLQTPLVPLPFLNASHGVTSVIFCCSMQQKLNQVKCHDQEMIQVKSNITNMSVFTLFDNCQVDRWPLSVQIMWARKKL